MDYKEHNRMVHYWNSYLNMEAANWLNPNIFKRGLKV